MPAKPTIARPRRRGNRCADFQRVATTLKSPPFASKNMAALFAFGTLAALLLVSVSSPAGGSSWQEPASGDEFETRVTDPSNDLRLTQGPNDVGAIPPSHAHVDLLAAWISNETVTEFEVGFALQTWNDPAASDSMASRYVQLTFEFGKVAYVATHGPGVNDAVQPIACSPTQASFGRGNGDGQVPDEHCLDLEIDETAALAHIIVPKDILKSDSFLVPQVGDELTNFFAFSRQFTGLGFVYDRAPDEGSGESFRFRRGAAERGGDLYLRSDLPLRASNGESTTMVFNVELGNDGNEEKSVSISANENDPDWSIRLPPRLRVPADSTVQVPVILSMNFSHEHMKTEYFRIRAVAVDDAKHWAEMELGVHWLEIPQPAGHHDKMWIHSRDRSGPFLGVPNGQDALGLGWAWMNAVEDDPNPRATDDPVPGLNADPGSPTFWRFNLEPTLQIGLDLDTSRLGLFHTEIFSYAPATAARLVAEVTYCDPTGTTPGIPTQECRQGDRPGTLVTVLSGTSADRALVANGPNSFAFELTPNETAELLQHRVGSTLTLHVTLVSNTPQSVLVVGHPPTATLNPKASLLTLPLHEYHDPVDQSFLNVGSLELSALDPFEKRLNPGRGAVFRFDVTNIGATEHTLRLVVEGINEQWASIHEGDSLVLPSRETRQVSLIVQAPHEASAGERAELFLVAESVEDPNVVALGRVRAMVIDLSTLDIPDEAASLSPSSQSNGTPGFGWIAVVVAAFIAVRSRRPGSPAVH